MKKSIKIALIVLGSLILLIILFIFLNVGFCFKEYNKAYYEWLPYSENDKIVFTNGKTDWEFTVTEAQKYHTDTYARNCKCGYCEDSFMVVLNNGIDIITINAMNYDNPDSASGPQIEITVNKQYYSSDTVFPSNGRQVIDNTVLIEKGKALTRFKYSDEEWKLKVHIKKGTEPVVD